MENNDLEENGQKNENSACGSDVAENPQEQPTTSQTSDSGKTSAFLVKFTQRKKDICKKLAAKRQQLQLRENELESNVLQRKENDMNVSKALHDMVISTEKQSDINVENHSINETLPNEVILNEDLEKPLHQHSKKELESIVNGFQELIFKLTLDDRNLKYKAKKIARNISGLKNFKVFAKVENVPSISGTRRQRCDSDLYVEERSNSKERTIVKKKEIKKEITPDEAFVKYINFILSEYFGQQQQNKLDTYKCLPAHLEDLESYATILEQADIGSIVEAEIRINRKNNRQSFISMSSDRETSERDAIILSAVARRYSFNGDIVKAFVLHPMSANSNKSNAENTDSYSKIENMSSHIAEDNALPLAEDEELFNDTENCRKAFVIKIVKQNEMREVVGSVSFTTTTTINSKLYYRLRPHDMRMPTVFIPKDSCTEEVASFKKTDICGMLYVVKIVEIDNGHCIGELVQPVGHVGNLQAEIKAILLNNGLKDIEPYDQKFNDMYEGEISVQNEEDLKYREDLRKKCVFTIDPLTAKDLDDAVSVEKLSNLEYEIGVHISDVSFYLEENSELDKLVEHRATSIYLVNEVIHMLPTSLCFKCSLLPGEDKFAFSVFWKWHTEKEELGAPRFTRSIINSCCQFAYEHAQKIIDYPMEKLDTDDFPDLLNGWTPDDIKWRVLFLHTIAQKLKARRYENGALTLNNTKFRFQLDPRTGEPLAYEVENRQEANFLIEEFMLLANQSAAKFIHNHFPDTSILRNHSPPLAKSMKALKERLNGLGLEFDITSSKSIYESMKRLSQESDDPIMMEACLSALLTKPMTRAREGKTSDADLRHYALSIPIYTHFTSPIRRYPDILVHRLLAAALHYCPPPQKTTEELHHLAEICNNQKFNAKNAGDESIELFFKRYVKAKQSITLKATVIEIFKYFLNVLTIETGHTIKIEYKLQKVVVDSTNAPSSIIIAEKNSQLPPRKLQVFSAVDINLVFRNEKICGYFATPDINQGRLNSKESSKRDNISNNSDYTATSEQDDDNTQISSSIPIKNSKQKRAKKIRKSRCYDLLKDQ